MEDSLYRKLLEDGEYLETMKEQLSDQLPNSNLWRSENQENEQNLKEDKEQKDEERHEETEDINQEDENGANIDDNDEPFKRSIYVNEIRKIGFPKDSLELYGHQCEKPQSVCDLKEREIEIDDIQKLVIINLIQMGVAIEQAIIVTDISKAGSAIEYFEYLDKNPQTIDHAFRQNQEEEEARGNFQSFGIVQKKEVCSLCKKCKTDHKYIYSNEEDAAEYNPYDFLRINSSNLKDQGEIRASMQELLDQMEENSLIIRENNDEYFINLEITQEDLLSIKRLRIASHIIYQTCQICYEEIELKNIIQYQGEYHDICISCFQTFLKENIKIGKVLNIQCPHCDLKLTYKFIQKMLDADTFAKYRQFLLDQLVSIDPSMRWCPNVKCGQSFKLRDNYKRKEKCDKCDTPLCTECNREYHKGSCNSVFQKEIKKWEQNSDIQRCKVCKTVVAKVSGCNHMTCKVCEYEWCWLCGARYDSIHFFFLNPFGCASLQFNSIFGWKLVLYRILIFISCLLLIPFLLVFFLPVFFIYHIKNKIWYFHGFKKVITYCFVSLGGFILQPLADALFFIVLIPGLIYFLCQRRKQKQLQIARSKKKLAKNQIVKNLGIEPEDLV